MKWIALLLCVMFAVGIFGIGKAILDLFDQKNSKNLFICCFSPPALIVAVLPFVAVFELMF